MAPTRASIGTSPVTVALGASWLARGAADNYSYKDVVPRYCNEAKDWGPLPPRPDGVSELLQVQAFFRHGARIQGNAQKFCWDHELEEGTFTCELSYMENSITGRSPLTPNFRTIFPPGRSSLPGNCTRGQLSSDGFDMSVNNGIRLRDAYITREGLLPDTLDGLDIAAVDDLLRFRSTDMPRTKQSLMAFVSGLWGPSQVGSLPYLPMRTLEQAEETMLVNRQLCPAVVGAGDRYFASLPSGPAGELRALCTWLNPDVLNPDVSGDTKACFWWLDHLLDCLMSRVCPTVPFTPHNVTVPAIFELDGDAALLRRVWRIVDEVHVGYSKEMIRAGAFNAFAHEVGSAAMLAAKRAEHGTPAPKLMVWSGHDNGPMEPLLIAWNLRKQISRPEFGSLLVMELWNSSQGVMVRWIDNGVVALGPVPLNETLTPRPAGSAVLTMLHGEQPCTGASSTDGAAGHVVGEISAPLDLPFVLFLAGTLVGGAAIFYNVWRRKDTSMRLLL